MSFQDIESNGVHPMKKPTLALSSGIFQINTKVSAFKKLVNNLGTPKDSPEIRKQLQKLRKQIGSMVNETSDALREASRIDHSIKGSAEKKYQDAKLAKDFQAVLQDYQTAQKKAAEWETAYPPFVPQAGLPSSYVASELNLNSQESEKDRAIMMEQRRQDVFRLENELAFNEAIIEEREESIIEIQKQLGEVCEIYTDLAFLVRGQGQTIGDIESNITNSEDSTIAGRRELQKAERNQKSGARLTCLMLVLFTVLLFVTYLVFVA